MLDIILKFNTLLNRSQKRKLIVLIIISTIGALFEMLGVSMIVPLVSTIMDPEIINTNRYISDVCALLHISSHKDFLIVFMIAMILLFVIKAGFLVFNNYCQAGFVYGCKKEMQQRVFRKIIHKPYEYFLYAESGEIMNILHDDILYSFEMLMTLIQLLSESIVSVAVIAVVFILNPLMTLIIAVLVTILILVILKKIRPLARQKGIEYSRNRSESNKWELQAIAGIKDIKVEQREKFFEENYYNSLDRAIESQKVFNLINGIPKTLIELGCICAALISMIIMTVLGRDLSTLISGFAALALAAVKLMPSANRIVNAVSSISYNRDKVDRLLHTLSEEDEEIPAEDSAVPITLHTDIRMEGITFRYARSDRYIFEDASVSIPAGQCVGIIGPSGTGKTTAVDILLGLLRPEKGCVYADGVDVMTNYQSWLGLVGYIPQSIFMLSGSIRENVIFGEASADAEERVWKVLREAQLADFVETLPEGIDTQIGERGIRLSGGQRQRIGIARALYNNPEVLIFDEATSSLDNETEAAIMESINALHGKKTMIIIAHRLQTIENCDIVYKVAHKKIEKRE